MKTKGWEKNTVPYKTKNKGEKKAQLKTPGPNVNAKLKASDANAVYVQFKIL